MTKSNIIQNTVLEVLFFRHFFEKTDTRRKLQQDLDLCKGLISLEERHKIQRIIFDPSSSEELIKKCRRELRDPVLSAKFCKLDKPPIT